MERRLTVEQVDLIRRLHEQGVTVDEINTTYQELERVNHMLSLPVDERPKTQFGKRVVQLPSPRGRKPNQIIFSDDDIEYKDQIDRLLINEGDTFDKIKNYVTSERIVQAKISLQANIKQAYISRMFNGQYAQMPLQSRRNVIKWYIKHMNGIDVEPETPYKSPKKSSGKEAAETSAIELVDEDVEASPPKRRGRPKKTLHD